MDVTIADSGTNWGLIISSITLGVVVLTTLVGLGRWWLSRRLLSNPFVLKYFLVEGRGEVPSDDTIAEGRVTIFAEQPFKSQNEEMELKLRQEYTLYWYLDPEASLDIYQVDLQFLGDSESKPKPLILKDLNQQALHHVEKYQRLREASVHYSPGMHTSKDKSVDYYATFETYAHWQGTMSMRIHLVGHGTRFIRIPVNV